MIDPKMLELSVYDDIPHLLSPVVTEPGKAIVALKWAVAEMENRYRAMSKLGVRNIEGYNDRMRDALKKGEEIIERIQTGFDETGAPTWAEQPMDLAEIPYIVVIVDEFADLMLVAGKDVENRSSFADGAGGGHSLDHGHAAPLGGCDYRRGESQLPDADFLLK